MNLKELSDEELLGLIAGGDTSALRVLYDRHVGWLVVRLSRRCSDRGLVDEVVQDTFLAVWRGAARFRGDGVVPAWIWGIGVRTCGAFPASTSASVERGMARGGTVGGGVGADGYRAW